MQRDDEDNRLEAGESPDDPPLQVLYPDLDRVSRSAFRRGSLSRRRIVAASLGMVAVAGVVAGLILFSALG